jgi:prepilin-type N-terminal cleavage/methylation domain-containing protein
MNRRPGVTLTEVLVAIFLVAVGLLALLVLFPLGALEMAQAIKDDRAGHAKHNAAAIANIWRLRYDQTVLDAMLNPSGLGTATPTGGSLASFYLDPTARTIDPSKSNLASYPVFIDPNGYWANAGNQPWRDWVAGQVAVVPRRVTCDPLKGGPNRPLQLQWTTLLDDMEFPRDVPFAGRPCPVSTPGAVQRTLRYSWAYMCQMPKAVAGGPVELSVILYSGRSLTLAGAGERAYSAVFNPGTNVVSVSWASGPAPDIQTGYWLMDASMVPNPHGFFYRIINAASTGTNSMDVEVQTPLQSNGPGTVVIMDNVVEVFPRGTF